MERIVYYVFTNLLIQGKYNTQANLLAERHYGLGVHFPQAFFTLHLSVYSNVG